MPTPRPNGSDGPPLANLGMVNCREKLLGSNADGLKRAWSIGSNPPYDDCPACLLDPTPPPPLDMPKVCPSACWTSSLTVLCSGRACGTDDPASEVGAGEYPPAPVPASVSSTAAWNDQYESAACEFMVVE